jgi:tellurite resistance protein TerC
LVVVAAKLIGSAFGVHIPNVISLSIIAFILGTGVLYSLVVKNPEEADEAA